MADLLPRRTPVLEGFDIAGAHETSFAVGGDYYEFLPLGEDRWGIAVADVVGKGIAAALLVAAMRASLWALVGQDLALRAILRHANRFLHQSAEEGKFVTLFYGVLDVRMLRLIYVNAGHLPPVLLHRDGSCELLEEGGMPLGLFEDARYLEGFAKLRPGDLLTLYTDGITDASNAADEPYGVERLVSTLLAHRDETAARLCETVFQDVRQFGGAPADDQTLVVLKAAEVG